ncbi:MAG: hypothetical protein AABY22_14030, partial [Nanoarchaeota archaeon]
MPLHFDGKTGEFDSCVSHFMGKMNQRTGKKFSSEEANKMCGEMQKRQESKENKFSGFGKLEIK